MRGSDNASGTSSSNSDQPALAAVLLQPGWHAGEGNERAAAAAAALLDREADAAALTTVQHSLAPAALPTVLQRLASEADDPGLALQQLLLRLSPAASQAMLQDPQPAHSALHHYAHLPSSAASASAAPWQLALALFASAGGQPGGECLLRLSAGDAMAAAVAAVGPATAQHCWLLLDEQQRQGGHRLAEAERQLASRWAASLLEAIQPFQHTSASRFSNVLLLHCGVPPAGLGSSSLF